MAEAGGQLVWVLAEMVPGHKIGERVQPAAGHSRDGVWGLFPMTDSENVTRPVQLARSSIATEGEDTHAGEDARTLEVKYAASGERLRNFKETVNELQQVEFDDWPLEPRTAMPCLKAVAQVAESAFGQHLSWVQQSRIPENDRVVHENEVLSRALDLAISYDSLNVANQASFELIIRRKQLLAEECSDVDTTPSYAGADHLMGASYRPGGAIIVPELTKYVADRMHQESQIMKEKRKQGAMKGGKGKDKHNNPPQYLSERRGGRIQLGYSLAAFFG